MGSKLSPSQLKRILIVEDSRFFSSLLEKNLLETGLFEVVIVDNLEAAQKLYDDGEIFFLWLLDLTLTDASGLEVLETVGALSVPTVIFSGTYNDEFRVESIKYGFIDYVDKSFPNSVEYIVSLCRRLVLNENIEVLLVDDNKIIRTKAVQLLEKFNFKTFQSSNGPDALGILEENPSISIMITDYSMPGMDGFELCRKVRALYTKEQLAIIGISAVNDKTIAPHFIRSGANDFITKPFQPEEFYCRLTQNVEMMEIMNALKVKAERDYLTGLYNRGAFFTRAEKIFEEDKNNEDMNCCYVLLDLDHFKFVNDTYGHAVGDNVLKEIGEIIMQTTMDKALSGRIGGEEFALVIPNMTRNKAQGLLETLRLNIQECKISYGDKSEDLSVTISIGMSDKALSNIDHTFNEVDHRLYAAKKDGRNSLVSDAVDMSG